MLLDRWNPVFAPETEAGTPEPAEPAPPPMNERPVDGPGSGRSAIRKDLEKGFETARKTPEPAPTPGKKGKYVSTARKEGIAEEPEAPTEEVQEPAEGQEAPAEASQHKVPDGWAKEAKAEWDKVLTDVADGFEAHRKLNNLDYDFNDKKLEKEMERKFKKGMSLFAKHYGSFWW